MRTTTFVIVACITVSNVPSWPWAEGTYISDPNLATCGHQWNARWRQIGGPVIIWSNYWSNWFGTLLLCDARHSYSVFRATNRVKSPVNETVWTLENPMRVEFDDNPNFAIMSSSCGRYPSLQYFYQASIFSLISAE